MAGSVKQVNLYQFYGQISTVILMFGLIRCCGLYAFPLAISIGSLISTWMCLSEWRRIPILGKVKLDFSIFAFFTLAVGSAAYFFHNAVPFDSWVKWIAYSVGYFVFIIACCVIVKSFRDKSFQVLKYVIGRQ
jgi:hypothetical protein